MFYSKRVYVLTDWASKKDDPTTWTFWKGGNGLLYQWSEYPLTFRSYRDICRAKHWGGGQIVKCTLLFTNVSKNNPKAWLVRVQSGRLEILMRGRGYNRLFDEAGMLRSNGLADYSSIHEPIPGIINAVKPVWLCDMIDFERTFSLPAVGQYC